MQPEDDVLPILRDPEGSFNRYVGSFGDAWPGSAYSMGKIALALKIETDRRIMYGLTGNSLLALSREEVVTVLETVLKNGGVWEDVQLWYDRLLKYEAKRRTVFEPEVEPAASADAAHPATPSPNEPSSESLEEQRTVDPDA